LQSSFATDTKNGPSEEKMVKIDVRDLNVWFGDKHVLKNIDVGLKPNAVTAIMGPSGCWENYVYPSNKQT